MGTWRGNYNLNKGNSLKMQSTYSWVLKTKSERHFRQRKQDVQGWKPFSYGGLEALLTKTQRQGLLRQGDNHCRAWPQSVSFNLGTMTRHQSCEEDARLGHNCVSERLHAVYRPQEVRERPVSTSYVAQSNLSFVNIPINGST